MKRYKRPICPRCNKKIKNPARCMIFYNRWHHQECLTEDEQTGNEKKENT